MAITTSVICNSFKKELFEGTHNFKQSGGNKDELLELLIKCYNYCLRPKSKHISNKVLN